MKPLIVLLSVLSITLIYTPELYAHGNNNDSVIYYYPPAVAGDGVLYVASGDGNVYALDIDGTSRWTTFLDDEINGRPSLDPSRGRLYATTLDGRLHALDVSGQILWRKSFSQDPLLHTVGPDGRVYLIQVREPILHAVSPEGKEQWKWTFDADSRLSSPPVFTEDGTLYVVTWAGELYAFHPDGTRRWQLTLSLGAIELATRGDRIYAINGNILHAINTQGEVLWTTTLDQDAFLPPVVGADGNIYLGMFRGWIISVSPDGEVRWQQKLETVAAAPTVSPSGQIYATGNESVFALSPDGELLWEVPTGTQIVLAPSVGLDDTVYVGSSVNRVYALQPTGEIAWSDDFPTGADTLDQLAVYVQLSPHPATRSILAAKMVGSGGGFPSWIWGIVAIGAVGLGTTFWAYRSNRRARSRQA